MYAEIASRNRKTNDKLEQYSGYLLILASVVSNVCLIVG